jgi:hypothetical protein
MFIATENIQRDYCGTASSSDRMPDSTYIWTRFWHHRNSSSVECKARSLPLAVTYWSDIVNVGQAAPVPKN